MTNRFSVKNKNVLILGGTGKIGLPLSIEFSKLGSNVFVSSRSKNIPDYSSKLFDSHNIKYFPMDVSDESALNNCIEKIINQFGEIDVLINLVSYRPMKKFMEDSSENWTKSIVSNSLAAFLPTRLIGKRMVSNQSGSIINFSSIYGLVSPPMRLYKDCDFETEPDYPFIKSGIIGLTKFFSSYYALHGVRVNVIAPGGVFNNQQEGFLSKYKEYTPMGRMADPDDILGLAVFLASDASKYITGTVIPVDGGWTAV